jgi:hypothetical protein
LNIFSATVSEVTGRDKILRAFLKNKDDMEKYQLGL